MPAVLCVITPTYLVSSVPERLTGRKAGFAGVGLTLSDLRKAKLRSHSPQDQHPSASSDDGQCPCYQLYCLISVSHSTLTCSLKGCDIIYSGTSHRKKYSYRRKKISFDVRHWRIEIFTFLLAFYIHPKRNHSPECHSVSLLCGNSNYPHLGEVLLGDCKEQNS